MARCGSCEAENPAHARFCLSCAAPLAAAPIAESRRTVTILFADMVASTERAAQLDPEAWRTVQSRYFSALRASIERHGGTVEKFIGDAVMAIFGWPTLHEDDALRAVRAAVELRGALAELNRDLTARGTNPIEVRVGVQTGEVLAADARDGGGALVTGDAVNVAARLQQAAAPDEVLLGDETARLVRDAVEVVALGAVDAKGKADGIEAARLVAIVGLEAHRRRFETGLVGRAAELAGLERAFERAVVARDIELLTVMAPAGVGKSRLVREFLGHVERRAVVLRGRCLNYGDGITYWAVGEIVRAAAGIAEADRAPDARARVDRLVADDPRAERIATVLASLLGLAGTPASGDDISWAFRRTLGLLASDRPVVLLVEDIHWAAPDLLDLVEALLDWGVGGPVLLLCTARPELVEARPAFGAGRPNATSLHLDPLGPGDARELIDELLGGAVLPEAFRSRIAVAAEGNPLFMEEMLGMLVDRGQLRGTDAGWVLDDDLADAVVPTSIRALLAARIDALERGERSVAGRAAVVGRTFDRGAVAELSPEAERGHLAARLLSLTRKQLIRPDVPGLDGDDAFRFRHVLIRDAAYEALPKAQRADLHERSAAWLERAVGDRRPEYVEILAHHLATAAEYHIQLGSLGLRPDLFDDALALLLDAADRAKQVHAYPEEVRLLRRAIELVERGPAATGRRDVVDLLERAAEAAWHGGDHAATAQLGDAALARAVGREVTLQARLHANAAAYARDVGDGDSAEAHVVEAVRLLAAGGEPQERAVVLAQLARLMMLANRVVESEALCREAIASGAADGATLASAHITLGTVLSNLRRVEEAERHFAEGRTYAEADESGIELGRWYNNYSILAGVVHGPAEAAGLLREGVGVLAERGMARTPFSVSLVLNLAVYDVQAGHADAAAAAAREVLEMGVSGAAAVWAASILAWANLQRSEFAEAQSTIDVGRRLVKRWPGAIWAIDLSWIEAELCLWRGSPERALAVAEESRQAAPAGDTVAVVRAIGLGLRALSDIAERVRGEGDDAAEMAIVRQAEALVAAADNTILEHPFAGSQLDQGMVLEAELRAELARARAASDDALWAECARLERHAGLRAAAAYSGWQRARAMEGADRGVAEIRDAVLDGLADADASKPARRELKTMAARLGIDWAAAPTD